MDGSSYFFVSNKCKVIENKALKKYFLFKNQTTFSVIKAILVELPISNRKWHELHAIFYKTLAPCPRIGH